MPLVHVINGFCKLELVRKPAAPAAQFCLTYEVTSRDPNALDRLKKVVSGLQGAQVRGTNPPKKQIELLLVRPAWKHLSNEKFTEAIESFSDNFAAAVRVDVGHRAPHPRTPELVPMTPKRPRHETRPRPQQDQQPEQPAPKHVVDQARRELGG